MNEEPQVPNGSNQTATGSAKKHRFPHLRIVLMALVVIIIFIFDAGELVKALKGVGARSDTMFSIPSEIFDEFNSCNYKYLFFCELKPGVAKCRSERLSESEREVCISVVLSDETGTAAPPPKWESIPYLNVALYSVVMLPRLPDALIQMLEDKRSEGHLEFSLGVFFVLAYISLMVAALREKSSMNLWFFVLTVVYGPYLIMGVFWILQHSIENAGAGISAAAGWLTTAVGIPACLMICVGHDAESVAKVAKTAGKGIGLLRH